MRIQSYNADISIMKPQRDQEPKLDACVKLFEPYLSREVFGFSNSNIPFSYNKSHDIMVARSTIHRLCALGLSRRVGSGSHCLEYGSRFCPQCGK